MLLDQHTQNFELNLQAKFKFLPCSSLIPYRNSRISSKAVQKIT